MRFLAIIVLLAVTLSGPRVPVASASASEDIVSYGIVAPGSGWILTPNHLYITSDEGGAWSEAGPSPGSGAFLAADFLSDGNGWLVVTEAGSNEPATLALAQTTDLGDHWSARSLSLPTLDDSGLPVAELELDLSTPEAGVLRARFASSSNFERRSEWRTEDGGLTWAVTGATEIAASATGAHVAVYLANGASGWRIEHSGACSENGATRTCEQSTALLETQDGGRTWRPIPLPAELRGVRTWTVAGSDVAAAGAPGGRTMIAEGQGFDKCEAATLDQLYQWRSSSPYSAVNLYIGGSLRACKNLGLNAEYLRSAYGIGWSFIPTWVGPQAPCAGFRQSISYDPATAYSEGWTEASAASDTLRTLGLAEADGSGSLVYYDMEAYSTGNSACNAAVQSFVRGWTGGLHARGNLAGLYGTGSTISLLTALSEPLDAIWAAHWIYSSYEPAATVWNVYKLGNDVWSSQQRLRQYTGGHGETWGGVSMNIDADVLDGPVALAGPAPTPTPTYTPTVTPTVTPTLSATPTPSATPTRAIFTPTAWLYLPLLVQ